MDTPNDSPPEVAATEATVLDIIDICDEAPPDIVMSAAPSEVHGANDSVLAHKHIQDAFVAHSVFRDATEIFAIQQRLPSISCYFLAAMQ